MNLNRAPAMQLENPIRNAKGKRTSLTRQGEIPMNGSGATFAFFIPARLASFIA